MLRESTLFFSNVSDSFLGIKICHIKFEIFRFIFLDKRKERDAFDVYVNDLKIKISDHEAIVSSLSGGNQQKIVLAKWLESNSDIIIFDEPTRGIDVGAKYEIYQLINQLADEGKSIIIVRS